MDIISASSITASALNAEKIRMDVVAENIANANTTRGVDGRPYQRRTVTFESVLDAAADTPNATGVHVAAIKPDTSEGPRIHNPSHPHADQSGMLQMPNVNVAFEMVDLVASSRSYEANLAVVRNARQMAAQALAIGR